MFYFFPLKNQTFAQLHSHSSRIGDAPVSIYVLKFLNFSSVVFYFLPSSNLHFGQVKLIGFIESDTLSFNLSIAVF